MTARRRLTAVCCFFLLAALMAASTGCGSTESPGTTTTVETPEGSQVFEFDTVRKTPHFETSTPSAGAVLPAQPINVVIDFNFDLGPGTSMSITRYGKEYGRDETMIDENGLTMRRALFPGAPDGVYEVRYDACWPDGSCHDGHFQFAVVSSLAQDFADLKGQKEVSVSMTDIAFEPRNIVISPGTRVTWTNSDPVEHFINTDSHPAHTYFLQQNSRGIAGGASFAVVFDTPGAYPYHCSAHADTMTGMIVVE